MTGVHFPHLRNAPATEAVIDVRMQPRADADPDALRKLASDGFTVEELTGFAGEIKFTPSGPQVRQERSRNGFRFASADGRVIVQATLDGLATSRLRPYTDWDDLVATAHDFYNRYVQLAKPVSAVRLGVRYINRFDLPSHVNELHRFLTAPPEPLPGMNGPIIGYLKRVVTAEDNGVTAITTQAVQAVYEAQTVMILDIDCSLTRGFEVSDPSMWKRFDEMRICKNQIFFENLTPETRKMYE